MTNSLVYEWRGQRWVAIPRSWLRKRRGPGRWVPMAVGWVFVPDKAKEEAA